MKVVIIGDVHGKTTVYQKMLRQRYHGVTTIQIGDMGIGFADVGLQEMPPNHTWFRGNHDNPEQCRLNKNYRGDWGYDPKTGIFHVAGAFSIDRDYRVAGLSWWPDEELSYVELQGVLATYKHFKPRFVVSHECPTSAARVLLHELSGQYFSAKMECSMSRTSEIMQIMLDAHEPEEWIFGHYHIDKKFQVGEYKTVFHCVAELSQYELETGVA